MSAIVTRILPGLILALALVSCASVSVDEGTSRDVQKMPEIIYVADFGTAQANFEVDRKGQELTAFKQNLQLMLKTGAAADLTDKLVPSVAVGKKKQAGLRNSWLVRGEFVKVEQGSRALRSIIGFGAGGTKLETKVEIYDLAQGDGTPFLTFSTTGGSGAEPGAISALSGDPLMLAIGGVSGAAHGLSEDTARTARMITAEISDYMHKHGWISDEQWIQPKRQGNTESW